jgi:uncharacterized MnhB-related membrane protein
MMVLQVVAVVLLGAIGTAVAVTRDLLHQALTFALFGLVLALVFLLYQAPDAALAQVVVSGLVVPLLLFVTLAELRGRRGVDVADDPGADAPASSGPAEPGQEEPA